LPVPATEPGGQLVIGHQLGGRGHGDATLAGWGAGGGGGGSGGSRRGRCWRGRCAGRGRGVDAGDQLVGRDGGAIGLHQFGQHAGGRRGDFEHHLVGLDLDQDLVHRHGFAGLLLPLSNVASATDSDSCGTLTSTIAMSALSVWLCFGAARRPAP
jgi:hypothetical protein